MYMRFCAVPRLSWHRQQANGRKSSASKSSGYTLLLSCQQAFQRTSYVTAVKMPFVMCSLALQACLHHEADYDNPDTSSYFGLCIVCMSLVQTHITEITAPKTHVT